MSTCCSSPDGLPVNPLTDPYFASLATHLLWNAPSATTVDIGGLAQLPGLAAGPRPPRAPPRSPASAPTAGSWWPATWCTPVQASCTPTRSSPTRSSAALADPVHLTSLSLDIVLVDPDDVVDPDRFFEGRFECALGGVDVTPADNTWKMRAGAPARVLSDQIPAGAACTVTRAARLARPRRSGSGPSPRSSPTWWSWRSARASASRSPTGCSDFPRRPRRPPPRPPPLRRPARRRRSRSRSRRPRRPPRRPPPTPSTIPEPTNLPEPAWLVLGAAHGLADDLTHVHQRRRGAAGRPAASTAARPAP